MSQLAKQIELDLSRSEEFLERALRFLNEATSSALCAELQAGDDLVLTRKIRVIKETIRSRYSETEHTKNQLAEFVARRKSEEAALDVLYPTAEAS